MKKSIKKLIIFTAVTALIICSFCFPVSAADPVCVPLSISSEEELVSFIHAYDSNNEYEITLTADITITNPFFPNTNKIALFKGYFNGNGKTITGLKNALINTIDEASIYDLTLQSSYISSSNEYVGALVNKIDGNCSISNVNVKNVNIEVNGGTNNKVGGIVGSMKDTQITNCSVSGEITNHQTSDGTGGICGYADGGNSPIIENCTSSAKVTADTNVGGIVGQTVNDAEKEIIACTNNGNVTANSGIAGGIVGLMQNCNLTGCVNTGTVNGAANAGGICGDASGGSNLTFNYCANTGNVTTNTNIGAGIIGKTPVNPLNLTIINCYNAGTSDLPGYYGNGAVENNSFYKSVSDDPANKLITEASLKRGYYIDSDGGRVYWAGAIGSHWKVTGSNYPSYSSSTVINPIVFESGRNNINISAKGEGKYQLEESGNFKVDGDNTSYYGGITAYLASGEYVFVK